MARLVPLALFALLAAGPADVEPEATLKGHTEPLRSVAFTPNGKFLVSCAYKEVRLWDLGAGKSQAFNTFNQYEYTWGTPRLSPDGKFLAVGGTYYANNEYTTSVRFVRIGDKIEPAGQLAPTPPDDYEHDTYSEVAFMPDSKVLAAVRYAAQKKTYTLGLYDVETRQALNDAVHVADSATKIAFTPDGKTLLSADAKGNVILWSARTGKKRDGYAIHKGAINDLAVSPDGKTLATAGDDKTVKIWDLEKGELKHTLTGHDDAVLCVAFARDGKRLASGGKDHNVILWDPVAGKRLATVEAHLNNVTCVAFAPDGQTLATGSTDKYVRLWDVDKALKAKSDK